MNNEKYNSFNKSTSNTPRKAIKPTQSATVPSKTNRTNISIIIEEKENPNYILNLNHEGLGKTDEVPETLCKNNVSKEESKCFCEIAIQCNKSDEDMLISQSVHDTGYWKLMAHKRYKALIEASKENSMVT